MCKITFSPGPDQSPLPRTLKLISRALAASVSSCLPMVLGGIGELVFANNQGVGGIGALVLADTMVWAASVTRVGEYGWAVIAFRPIALVTSTTPKLLQLTTCT